jgi:hypothetical protein
MSTANPGQPALESPNSDATVLAPRTHVPKHRHHFITKILFGAAIVLSSAVIAAATSSADPVDTVTNPFRGLRCGCPATALVAGPALQAAIDRGLQEGHSAWLPGLTAPARPGRP